MMTERSPAQSIYDAFVGVARHHAVRPFLRAPAWSDGQLTAAAVEYSYHEAHKKIDSLRAGYAQHGVQAGTRVATAFDSGIETYLHLLALNALGASIVPLNMSGNLREIRFIIEHSKARCLTGAAAHDRVLSKWSNDRPGLHHVAASALKGDAPDAAASGVAVREAALLYTSGTTGQPKGCMLSNEYFLTMGREYNGLGHLCSISDNDRLLTPLPPHHMNALSCSFMAMLMCGGCIIQLDRFHPNQWWRTVREEKASVIHYLGVMPAILLTMHTQDDDWMGDQVRFGFGAGSDPRHQLAFEQRFGFPLIEAWAMTETGGAAMIVAHEPPRHEGQRCIGRPHPRMAFRIVDEQHEDVPKGHDGELLVRRNGSDPRKGFFSGYYGDAAATEEGWADGWWHTGDVVREGKDGALFFVDRRKNVIRRSGENIAAVEVEAILLAHDAVANCAVTAVPDELRGDEVFAWIVTTNETNDDSDLGLILFDHCMAHLSYFKAPAYWAFTGDLPLTGAQKVNRAQVKRDARERLSRGDMLDLRHKKKRTM